MHFCIIVRIMPPHELIETLWNVNSIDVVIDNIRDIELIETLWNVNAISVLDCAFNASRIN